MEAIPNINSFSDDWIENGPLEKKLGLLVNEIFDISLQPESQLHPGLHQRNRGQQVKGGDSPLLLR